MYASFTLLNLKSGKSQWFFSANPNHHYFQALAQQNHQSYTGVMEYGFVGQLYRFMKDGDTNRFCQALRDNPASALNLPADGCVAPVLISAVFAERVDYLEELLKAGADPNLRDTSTKGSAHNLCALHAALWFERVDMATLLRDYGAAEDFGTAVFSRDIEAVRRQLQANPDLIASAFMRSTFTLLHVAANLGHQGLTELFLEAGLDPRQTEADGHAPLYYAARNSPAIGVMEALVTAGAEVNAASNTGLTALSAACRRTQSLESVIWLLKRGANPNLIPKDKNSPLLRAVRLKNTPMVQALLNAGADPNYAGKKGETAIAIAEKKQATEILALLHDNAG